MNFRLFISVFIFWFFTAGCNKKKNEEVPVNNPPIDTTEVVYERACQPGEIIKNTAAIEAYSDKQSYAPSELIQFYVHSSTPIYEMKMYRFGTSQDLVLSKQLNNGIQQDYLCYAYENGCNWKKSFDVQVPSSFISGLYSAELSNSEGSFWVSFVIKTPRKKSNIAVLASTNTWTAYNTYAGGSFYMNSVEEETEYSPNVSFLRPNERANPFTERHLTSAELHFLKWLEDKSYPYDMFCAIDLHFNPIQLQSYKVLVIQAHPEYYTETMYAALKDYVNNGGHLMYLGGNGLYAKVVYNPDKIGLELRRDSSFHDYKNERGGLWRNLDDPESGLLGVQYNTEAYNTHAPYKVIADTHWVYTNTNLSAGDSFGGNCGRGGASGHETDKITPSSPKGLIHLAKGENPGIGGADMVYYETVSGGKVFSVGSITYTSCINEDQHISQITENVLNEFLK